MESRVSSWKNGNGKAELEGLITHNLRWANAAVSALGLRMEGHEEGPLRYALRGRRVTHMCLGGRSSHTFGSVSRVSLEGAWLNCDQPQARVRTMPDHDSSSGHLLCTAPTGGPGATGSHCTAPRCDEPKCKLLSQCGSGPCASGHRTEPVRDFSENLN